MLGELFKRKFRKDVLGNENIPSDILEKRIIKPDVFLNWTWSMFERGNHKIVGFKIFGSHLERNNAISLLVKGTREARKIVLYRSDFLAEYASKRTASSRGDFSSVKNHTEKRIISVEKSGFNYFVTETLTWYQQIITILDQTKQNYFVVEYGRDLMTQESTENMFKRLEVYLNFSNSKSDLFSPPVRNMKQSKWPLNETISNWDNILDIREKYDQIYYSIHEFISLLKPSVS